MKLKPDEHQWLQDPGLVKIFSVFPANSIRAVGGCVRNSLWGEAVGDIDLATRLRPDEVINLLKDNGIKSVPTGLAHGTVTAVIDGQPYEITSLRKDVETDGRRAVIAFTEKWEDDALRRDFTVNALYVNHRGEIFDPTGLGLEDAERRVFRFVGQAEDRVREDYLRILRYFRFLAYYGKNRKVDAEALRACREHHEGLRDLSAERVWSEIKKTLTAKNPSRSLRIMLTNDIINLVLPEASNVEGLELMVQLESRFDIEPDPLLRLMAMSARDEMALSRLAKRLKLSNSEKGRLLTWAGNIVPFELDMDQKRLKQSIYASTIQTSVDRLLIRAAGEADPILQNQWVKHAEFAKGWKIPEFPIKGKDLELSGIKSGPEMGRILKALKELWVRSGFETKKPQLLMALQLIKSTNR